MTKNLAIRITCQIAEALRGVDDGSIGLVEVAEDDGDGTIDSP